MSSPEAETASALASAAVRLIRRLRAQDDAARLTGPQASALAVVVHARRIKVSDLAGLEQVSRPTISKTVRELEAAGLIGREADPADGRVAWLSPTPDGEALMAEGHARRTAPLARRIAALPDADRRALERALPVLERLAQG